MQNNVAVNEIFQNENFNVNVGSKGNPMLVQEELALIAKMSKEKRGVGIDINCTK